MKCDTGHFYEFPCVSDILRLIANIGQRHNSLALKRILPSAPIGSKRLTFPSCSPRWVSYLSVEISAQAWFTAGWNLRYREKATIEDDKIKP